jgi:hypothetical protein
VLISPLFKVEIAKEVVKGNPANVGLVSQTAGIPKTISNLLASLLGWLLGIASIVYE